MKQGAYERTQWRPSAEKLKERWTKYNEYTPEQRVEIGRYVAENGPTRPTKHVFHVLNTNVPEPITAFYMYIISI